MKKRLWLLLIVFTLSGCAHKVEMTQIGVVSGLGIDKVEGGYRVTAQSVNINSVAGNQHDTLPVYSISAEGETIYEAYRQLSTLTSKVLYLPHLSVIIIDEEIAKTGITPILDFTLRNSMIRPNISLIIANNAKAEAVLQVLSPSEQIPVKQLDSLTNLCLDCTGRLVDKNLYEVSETVNSVGDGLVLNSVAIVGDDLSESGTFDSIFHVTPLTQLAIDKLAVFKGDQLVGYITNHEAELYNLLVDSAKRYLINTTISEEYKVSFEARSSSVEITPNIDEGKVSVNCEVKGILMENTYPIDLMNPDNLEVFKVHLSEELKGDLEDFIRKTQQELQSDIFGIGGKIHQKEPNKWSEISGYWDEIYPTLEFEVTVNVDSVSVGDIANITN